MQSNCTAALSRLLMLVNSDYKFLPLLTVFNVRQESQGTKAGG